ncbi:MFS transporter [Archangium lansingense]|uniref:MFS transporter n=1 Tax=Archangium lansingense TaxID=2995310 RepID=UPI003B7852CC
MQLDERERNLRVLWGSHFLSVTSLCVIAPLLPFFLRELGATSQASALTWSGFALAAPAVTYAVTAPLWGRLGDRWGQKWMVVRALAGLALTLILMGYAETPFQFFLLRLLQGAFGGVVSAGTALASTQASAESRGQVLGRLESAVAAGSLMGPIIGGVLMDWWSFRHLLILLGGLLGLSAVAAVGLLNRDHPVASVAPRAGIWGTFGQLLGERRVRRFLVAGICANLGVYGLVAILAARVKELSPLHTHAATWVGVMQAVTWAAALFGAPWWGRRNDTSLVERNFIIASLLCGTGVALQALPLGLEWLLPWRALQGFGFSALLPSALLIVSQAAPESQRGAHIGAANSLLVMGQIGGSLVSAFLARSLSPAWIFVTMSACFVAGAAAVWGPQKSSDTVAREGTVQS